MKELTGCGLQGALEWDTRCSLRDPSFTLRQPSLPTPMLPYLQIFLSCLNCELWGVSVAQQIRDLFQMFISAIKGS